MKTIKYIVLLLTIISLGACEKEATNVDVPVVQPKLVVATFLNPHESYTSLYLSWSNPIYHNTNNQIKPETQAKVYIESEGVSYPVNYSPANNRYEIAASQMKIVSGKSYHLKIESDKVDQVLKAETIVPAKPDFTAEYKGMDSITIEDGYGSYTEYRLYVDLHIKNAEHPGYYRVIAQCLTQDGDLIELYMDGYQNKKIYGDFNERLNIWPEYYDGNSFKPKELYISVQKADESFYRYMHSLEMNNDIEIFTEPTQIYSNVENALGVFCSFYSVTDTLVVKK